MNKRGKFITFEGGEGSGKTTHLESLAGHLRAGGYKVKTTHDPGGAEISIGIRPFLLDKKYKVSHEAEFLLYLAARAELVQKVILPALPHVDFVLCDRFYDSTAVYQGVIRKWDEIWAYEDENFLDFMHRLFSKNITPDKTFLFNVSPKIGLSRSKGFDKNESRWEEEGLKIHTKINLAFLELANYGMTNADERFVVIDADKPEEWVFSELIDRFNQEVL